MVGIQYAKNNKQRQPLYENLLKYTRKVIGYAGKAEGILEQHSSGLQTFALLNEIKHYTALSEQVYDQTYRRVIQGETAHSLLNVSCDLKVRTKKRLLSRKSPLDGIGQFLILFRGDLQRPQIQNQPLAGTFFSTNVFNEVEVFVCFPESSQKRQDK